jgi:large subunit ribosomal protein L30
MAKLEITQIKSAIGRHDNQAETLRSLGLKRIGHTVIKEDRPEFLGMINTVSHLVEVKEV